MTATTLTRREEMLQIYSDYHKEAYGFRPRGYDYSAFTLEQLEADFALFAEICKENQIAEDAAAREAVANFEANVQKLISMGAGDEATALRWIAEAGVSEDGWDMDYHLWKLGISKYDEISRPICVKLEPHWNNVCKVKYQ